MRSFFNEKSSFPKAFSSYKPSTVFGVILVSKDKKVLLVKGRKAHKWSFPKGHLEGDETWSECAIRECHEETGIYLPYHFDMVHKKPYKLFSGHYYVYKNTKEIEPFLMDISETSEIMEVEWIPIEKVRYLRVNIDVNTFLDSYEKISDMD
jgi:8-oxo-dGTP pyrophosphatase MutT (NUDIX family)